MTATQKKSIETSKDKAMEAAERRARAKIAAAPGNKKIASEAWSTLEHEKADAQKLYEKQIGIMTGGGGAQKKTATKADVAAFAEAHHLTPEQANGAFTSKGYVIQ
jgi:hypothetical protein